MYKDVPGRSGVGCLAHVLDFALSERELPRMAIVRSSLKREDGIETAKGTIAKHGQLGTGQRSWSSEDDDAAGYVVLDQGRSERDGDSDGACCRHVVTVGVSKTAKRVPVHFQPTQ